MTDTKNFQFLFFLEHIKFDTREFRQDSELFRSSPHTPIHIAANLPRDAEYVFNLSEISMAELSSNDTPPEPILTPKGYAYLKKVLEMGFDNPNLKETLPESEDWGNTVDKEKSLNPEKIAPEDDWGKAPFEDNKVESETWEDEKEEWQNDI